MKLRCGPVQKKAASAAFFFYRARWGFTKEDGHEVRNDHGDGVLPGGGARGLPAIDGIGGGPHRRGHAGVGRGARGQAGFRCAGQASVRRCGEDGQRIPRPAQGPRAGMRARLRAFADGGRRGHSRSADRQGVLRPLRRIAGPMDRIAPCRPVAGRAAAAAHPGHARFAAGGRRLHPGSEFRRARRYRRAAVGPALPGAGPGRWQDDLQRRQIRRRACRFAFAQWASAGDRRRPRRGGAGSGDRQGIDTVRRCAFVCVLLVGRRRRGVCARRRTRTGVPGFRQRAGDPDSTRYPQRGAGGSGAGQRFAFRVAGFQPGRRHRPGRIAARAHRPAQPGDQAVRGRRLGAQYFGADCRRRHFTSAPGSTCA